MGLEGGLAPALTSSCTLDPPLCICHAGGLDEREGSGRACRVFTSGGGGGSIEPPKTGGGFEKRAQLTGTINQSLRSRAPKAPKIFLSIKIGRFFFTKYMANDDFSEPSTR